MNLQDVNDWLAEMEKLGWESAHIEEDRLMLAVLKAAAEGEDVKHMATMVVAAYEAPGKTRWYA
jgi:hypothetical protein